MIMGRPLRFLFKASKISDTPVFHFVQYRHRNFLGWNDARMIEHKE